MRSAAWVSRKCRRISNRVATSSRGGTTGGNIQAFELQTYSTALQAQCLFRLDRSNEVLDLERMASAEQRYSREQVSVASDFHRAEREHSQRCVATMNNPNLIAMNPSTL